jgi:hypothetical protein
MPRLIRETSEDYLASCVCAVEASHCEVLDIWTRFSDPENPFKRECRQYDWKDVHGWLETIGHLDNRPICIDIRIVELDGRRILFWEGCSQLVDYAMIERWFANKLPYLRKTNAMNVHIAVHEIDRLNEDKR